MTWPVILLWLLIAYGAVSRGFFILYLFSASVIFGGLTMAPPGLTGGLNLPPQTICAAVLIAKIMIVPSNLGMAARHLLDVRKLGLLLMLAVYVVFSALVFPRLFAGDVQLYSLNAAGSLSFLQPTSANFTQALYLLISIGIAVSFGIASRNPEFRRHYFRSVLVAGVCLLGSGIIDSVAGAAHAESLLTPLHNASYNLLSTEELGGEKRVVGFMAEASVFGQACGTLLGFIVFNFRAFEPATRKFFVPALMFALAYITYKSTSSTGYVGMAVLGATFGMLIATRILLVPIRNATAFNRVFYTFGAAAVVAVIVVLLPASVYLRLNTLLNAVLFQKADSGSYLERSRWTAAGLNAFWGTHGIGAGVGSVRTSNWFVNFLASTGIFGVLLLGLFSLKILLPFGPQTGKAVRSFSFGLKLSLLPALAMVIISGTTPDPGVFIMATFGLLYGLRLRPAANATGLWEAQTAEPRLALNIAAGYPDIPV